jgi:hypothetical protein
MQNIYKSFKAIHCFVSFFQSAQFLITLFLLNFLIENYKNQLDNYYEKIKAG